MNARTPIARLGGTLLLLAASLTGAQTAGAPLSSPSPSPSPKPAPATSPVAVPDTMAQRVIACSVCHGKEGRATNEGYFPRIAGKPAGYLYNQLVNFRDDRRRYAAMAYLVEHTSDAYMRDIADYFAALELPYPPPQTVNAPQPLLARGAALALRGDAARGLPACAVCHGERLTGVQPALPGLLGLPRDYLQAQLGAWRTGQRKAAAPDCMGDIARRLSHEDLNAVATWLSAQPVPADAHPARALAAPLPVPCGGQP